MNRSMLMMAALFAALSLGACQRPTVINVPAPEAVPGPAGATGATGATGEKGTTGTTGSTGTSGENTTVIVMPPAASEPAR
jgi:hypothetical protein